MAGDAVEIVMDDKIPDILEADLPPTVENHIPTAEEMEFKACNGRYYLDDVNVIIREFPSAHVYDCRTDLPKLCNKLFVQIRDIGYEFQDVSDRMNGVTHALKLTMAWAQIVREARTKDIMYLVRRTPENSGAMLMVQRQEHLRAQCSEMAPLAYIALVRGEQLVVTRDRVADQDTTERLLIQWAKNSFGEFLDEKEEQCTQKPDVPNMPAALFKQQMHAVEAMLEQMQVIREDEDTVRVEVSEATAEGGC